jgi:2-polyprenyl-3-methyl-5-hydroxy-6-metoxy-1,4-benzoquinol methylase
MFTKVITNNLQCHLCESPHLTTFHTFENLGRATSDCKPWPNSGKLGICVDCHTVQKVINDFWREESADIYANYELYHQSPNAKEQPVFNSITGISKPRSMAVLDYIQGLTKLSDNAKILDIGCGVGNMLKSLSQVFDNAQLYGFEPNAHKKLDLEKITNVKKIYTKIEGLADNHFDVMTMIHVLEHIESPVSFLKKLKNHITPAGYLIIAVPDYTQNPFDLIIADHASHFSMTTLKNLLVKSGFDVIDISDETISKEIVAICKIKTEDKPSECANNLSENHIFVQKQLDWLVESINTAKKVAQSSRPFGIFGTSIAANWIYGELSEFIDFFVDEDLDRVGQLYHQKPVYSLNHVPQSSHVFVCLQPSIVKKVMNRITSSKYFLYATPEL